MPLEASCIQYSCRGSNPGPSACEADVMTNYTTRACLVCVPPVRIELTTSGLLENHRQRVAGFWIMRPALCRLS